MRNIEYLLDANGIIIPTGSHEQDLERAEKAFEIGEAIKNEYARMSDLVRTAYGKTSDIAKKLYAQFGGLVKRVPYIISGMGPDTNKAILDSKGNYKTPGDSDDLDFHYKLWGYLEQKYDSKEIGIFGVDINSMNSKQNLLETFPEDQEGKYVIVSYPLHLARFKLLERKFRRRKQLSDKLELHYVPTKSWRRQSLREWIYGIAALVKDFFFG